MALNRKFITTCTLTFKAFDFDVTMSESKSTLWNFVAFNPNNQKRYAVFCTPAVSKVKGLIKVALKKLPAEHRLVVVAETHSQEEQDAADQLGYCLVSLNTLNEYGQEMLEIRENETAQGGSETTNPEVEKELDKIQDPSDFVDKVIHKDKLF
jgi:hypothetical protein